ELLFDDVFVTSKQASTLTVIVNEFIANSVKHAFPHGRRGSVIVRGRQISDSAVEVVLTDDGVGSAVAPTDRSPGAGLGLKIIAASVAQLGGELDRDSTDRGTRMTVTFSLQA